MNIKDFLMDGFPFLSAEKAKKICDNWPLKIVVFQPGKKKIVGVAFYMFINDEALEIISDDLRYISDPRGFDEIAGMPGKNLHIFCLHTKGIRHIFGGIKKLFEMYNCKSISWINKDMSKIIIIPEERLCQRKS